MVRSDPPEFVNTTDCVWLVPTMTFPKLMLVGATDSWPTVVVPENESRVAEKVKLGNIKEAKRRREIVWARMPSRRTTEYCTVPPCNALLGLQSGGIWLRFSLGHQCVAAAN
jgi:hypothetical protein